MQFALARQTFARRMKMCYTKPHEKYKGHNNFRTSRTYYLTTTHIYIYCFDYIPIGAHEAYSTLYCTLTSSRLLLSFFSNKKLMYKQLKLTTEKDFGVVIFTRI